MSIAGGRLYIADTDNHAIRMVDLKTGEVATLELSGMEPDAQAARAPAAAAGPAAPDRAAVEEEEEEIIELPLQQVAPGSGSLEISIELPPGHKLSLEESFYFSWGAEDPEIVSFPEQPQSLSGPHPRLPLRIPAAFSEGRTDLKIEMTIFYCPEAGESLCLLDAPLLRLPVQVSAAAPESALYVRHLVVRED